MKKNQKNNDKEWKIKNEKLEMKITAYYQKIARETSIVFLIFFHQIVLVT